MKLISQTRNIQDTFLNPGTISEQQSSATGVTFDSTDEKLQRRSERAADLEEVHEDSKAPGVR